MFCFSAGQSLIANDIGDAGCAAFASGLREGAEHATAAAALRVLSLSHNQIGDAGCAALALALPAIPALAALYLADNVIGEIGVSALAAGCGAVSVLHVWRNNLNDSAAKALGDLITLPSLRAVHVGMNGGMHASLCLLSLFVFCLFVRCCIVDSDR